jgi:hypothetical protein
MKDLVSYVHYKNGTEIGNIEGQLYQYITAGNGVFVQAKRPGLEAVMCLESTECPIRGLKEIFPFVKIDGGLVPNYYLQEVYEMGKHTLPNELLVYFSNKSGWDMVVPEQEAGPNFVIETNPKERFGKIIEIHTHPGNWNKFSSKDNADEQCFRIYTILSNIRNEFPVIRTRVGIYGYFMDIPSCWVYELGKEFVDYADVTRLLKLAS